MDKYIRGKTLGKGSYGVAYLAVSKEDGCTYVVKDISLHGLSKKGTETTLQEAKLLLALKHPNIVSCTEAFQEDGHLYIVLELCAEGDLSQALKKQNELLPEPLILDWLVQLCLGLKHIHDRKIVHRDIKPQNVFVSSGGLLKLGDFGVSRVLNTTAAFAKTLLGTPYYLSPEICSNRSYNQKTDIWSLGCVLYEIVALRKPFVAATQALLSAKIKAGLYPPLPPQYSRELRALVASMLQVNPSHRPTANQVLALPLLRNRIPKFMSETLRHAEFSHTVLHDRKLLASRPGTPRGGAPKPPPPQRVPQVAAQQKAAPPPPAAAAPKAPPPVDKAAARLEAQRQRAKAAADGQSRIAQLRLQELHKVVLEEHRRAEEGRVKAAKAKAAAARAGDAAAAAAAERARQAAAEKAAAEKAALLAAAKERERQQRRQATGQAIRQQKAAWAAGAGGKPAAAKDPEPLVLVPKRPPPPVARQQPPPPAQPRASAPPAVIAGAAAAADTPRHRVRFASFRGVGAGAQLPGRPGAGPAAAAPPGKGLPTTQAAAREGMQQAQQAVARAERQDAQPAHQAALAEPALVQRQQQPLPEGPEVEPDEEAFGEGFSASGIYTLENGEEVDIGVDWSEPLDVKARAIKRALRRRLGADALARVDAELKAFDSLATGDSTLELSLLADRLEAILGPEQLLLVPLLRQLQLAEALLSHAVD